MTYIIVKNKNTNKLSLLKPAELDAQYRAKNCINVPVNHVKKSIDTGIEDGKKYVVYGGHGTRYKVFADKTAVKF